MLATLIRLLGDFELAEEALHDAFIAAVEQWPRDGIPRNPRAWLVSAGRFKAIDNLRRRARFDASQRLLAEQLEEQAEAPAEEGDAVEDDRLRLIFTCCHPALTPEAQVALPPGADPRGTGGADPARGLRPAHRGDRPRLPRRAQRHRPTHRAGQEQDPRGPDSLPGTDRGGTPRAAGQRPASDLPGVQRGLLGLHRHQPDPRRSQRRGDPRRPPAGRTAARPRGPRPARPDVAARLAAPGADLGQRRTGAARRAGPHAMGSRTDRRGARPGRAGPGQPPFRGLHPTSGHRRGARPGPARRGHRLGTDRRPLRRAAVPGAIAGDRTQPRRGLGHARWRRGRAGRGRCVAGAR